MSDTLTAAADTGQTPLPVRRLGLVRHGFALAGRNITKIRRNPGSLGDAVFAPIIFLLMFVYLFGGAVAGSSHAYLQRVFPGVLVLTVIMAGLVTTGVNLNIDIKQGVFDRFRSLPIGRSVPLVGSVLGDLVRYLLSIAVLFACAYPMGFRVTTGVLPALAAVGLVVVFGFCLAWAYVLIGVVVRTTSVVQSVVVLGMFPLAFGTDMVAPRQTLPGWLQAWVSVNPVNHVVAAARGLLVGGPVAGAVTATLVWSAVLFVVFAPLAVLAYRRRT
ncbi:transport permease protein [Actinocatenispora thailandica]|uniref:Transport permease protein n=1 Tax=Actinocatenispora thailandica TaxID=227318 RepID=A0A7R7HWG2_9ACTN|nr:ABC transporter permease [Actinocatenispora thailandica]BCJ33949.1 transport permease protein [Actinocatenispora thailandica]